MITYQDIKSGAVPANFTSADQVKGRPSEDVKDWDLDLTKIKLDQSAQPRESLNNDRIAEYAEAMKAGDQFPPLTVFHDGSTYWLADGFHRHYAAQHAGRKHIRCYVRQGGLRDAILYSVGANAKHGLARSDEDKKRAIMRLLDDAEWSQWSDREIARRCRVSDKTVAKYRPAVSADDPQIERKVQRGGTVYTQKVAKGAVNKNSLVTEGGDEKQEITSQTVAQQGGEGGDEPQKFAEEITPRNIVAEILALWSEANDAEREEVLAVIKFQAKASEDNGATGKATIRPADCMTGEVSRVDAGRTASATSERMDATAGETATNSRSEPGLGHAPVCDPLAAREADESAATYSNSSELSSSQALTDSPVLTSSPASGTPFQTLSPADRIKALRPNCLRPELCAGSGRQHCYSCRKAAGDEGEAA